jgi:Zn-dependent protease
MITVGEFRELIKALLATALAFGILISHTEKSFALSFSIALLTVGLGFALHELAHKYVAIKYRRSAEFKANNSMLVIAIIMSFFGFIIAAPGAVWIRGLVTRRQSGVIAAAGPLTNVVLAIIFIPLIFIVPKIAYYGFMINALLALFNMIPVPGFDGQKVFYWSKPAYFTLAAIALALNLAMIILPEIARIT